MVEEFKENRKPFSGVETSFGRWTERAKKVLDLAQNRAAQAQADEISINHLVLGIFDEKDGLASKVLANMLEENFEAFKETVHSSLNIAIEPPPASNQDIKISPLVGRAIGLASDAARRLNHHYIGTEHMLLGILKSDAEPTNTPSILKQSGITFEKAEEETKRILNPTGDDHKKFLGGLRRRFAKDNRLSLLGLGLLLEEGWSASGRTIYEPEIEKRILEIRKDRLVLKLANGLEFFSLDGMAEIKIQNLNTNPSQNT